jgi:nitrite reductase [NAD(P)H], large subunit
MESLTDTKKKLVVVGNGMTGFKFCQKLVEKGLNTQYEIIVFGEEPYAAYDRVHLTSYYTGTSIEELTLAPAQWYADNSLNLRTQMPVSSINKEFKTLTLHDQSTLKYDILVLATGSSAFVPPIPGIDLTGVFVYRTFEDIDAIKSYIPHAKTGVVIGGGLLGLEAAKALMDDGVETTIVERAPWLMGRQLDKAGGAVLKRKMEAQNLSVMTDMITDCFAGNDKVEKIVFSDKSELPVDVIVISAGIKPRDELARTAGLEVGKMGGIVVDEQMMTSGDDIYAIGECALAKGMIWGLVAPCYQMAEVLVERLAGIDASFKGSDMSTKLKLIGTEVASFGDATGTTEGAISLVLNNHFSGTYKRINVTEDGKYLLGGILIGDASEYNMLHQTYKNKIKLPDNPESILYNGKGGEGLKISVLDLPDDAIICSCEGVTKGRIIESVKEFDLNNIAGIKKSCKAGTGCGGCIPMLDDLMTAYQKSQGKEVKKVICEHFNYTRQELFDLIKIDKIKTFNELIHKHGKGHGCEICKPLGASLLASAWNDVISKQSTIQDTNDRFLANIQRGGTYSVVPRIPGGEITPQKLGVISRVADKYNLYTKITGGQRIDMFGARVDQLPEIWQELVDEGFESGHAYGKSLRTVKSCVGSTWCRFGLNDSVSFAIEVEERYKGLRAPHKIKGGVSGCIRECAEARGKDFGIIATEKGWNLYVCGNGGANPAHAILLAADVDKETCIKYLDRFLIYYIKTAGPLTRTSKWLASLDGGIEHLKEVIVEDTLGLGAQFEAEMQTLIDNYKCEWKEVVENPELRKQFKAFINKEEHDKTISFVGLRDQKMPPAWQKK